MYDNFPSLPIGLQIRHLRRTRGLSLARLGALAGTSAPAIHRYEGGWDRFTLPTLRRIASALGARLEVRLIEEEAPGGHPSPPAPGADVLVREFAPLFWDRDLSEADFESYPDWVLARVLNTGDLRQVRTARTWFGDEAIRRVIRRRGIDARTRCLWEIVLGDDADAPESSS